VANRDIHDNFVLGYTVDSEAKTIRIRTEFRDRGKPFEKTDVLFEGVEAYRIIDGLIGILFDIEETSTNHILDEYRSEFEWGIRYGWPGMWNNGRESVVEYIQANGLKVFWIHSSTTFDGFVIARSMNKIAMD